MADAADFSSKPIDQNVYAEQVKLLYKALPFSVAANFVAGLLIVGVQWIAIDSSILLPWLACFQVIVIARAILYFRYLRVSTIENFQYWGRAFSAAAAITGIMWGIAGIVMFPPGNQLYQMTLVFCLLGMSAGSVSSHSFLKTPPFAFIILTLTPLFFRFLYESTHFAYLMAMILVLCISYLIVAARHSCKTTENNIRLRFNAYEKEREVEKSRRIAEAANLAKDDFISSMSHELRTPLNSVLGFSQLLELNAKDPITKESTQEIIKAGNHLLSLINDILDFSAISSGKLKLNMEDVELNQVVSECIDLVRPLADEYGISVNEEITTQTHYLVHVDYLRLTQIFLNLVSNAIKYNNRGGQVHIRCAAGSTQRLRVLITDSGRGMSEEQQQKLFEPFERMGAERTDTPGTGIGLVITRRLVESMGGAIGVESKKGEGSTFWFEINMSNNERKQMTTNHANDVTSEPNQTGHSDKTILYIEDSPANFRLIKSVIEMHTKYRILPSANAVDGIKLAESQQPDLILMDINLPEMDGYEATKQLSQNEKTRHIPVIAVTASATETDIKRGEEAGFKAYLTKPVNIVEFLETINTHI